MKIIYEAFDGNTFETEEECREYEDRRDIKYLVDVKFFNAQGNQIIPSLEDFNFDDDVFAVEILSTKGYETLYNYLKANDNDYAWMKTDDFGIPIVGLWYYDYNDWISGAEELCNIKCQYEKYGVKMPKL